MNGVLPLLRQFLRRDRWMIFWWTLAVTFLYWSQAVSVERLYTSQEDFDRAAASMGGNAAFVAMAGPARALNTIGGQVSWQSTAFGAITAGLMSMFLLGRHTRAEEESGRDELLRAGAISRRAPMTAALVETLLANALLGACVALSLVTFPLAAADSIALGAGLMLTGWVFTGCALIAAQLTSSTRSMYGLVGVVLGVAYALRAIGDVSNQALSWLSPIGWYQGMHAFSGLRWWPVLPLLAATLLTCWIGYAVFLRRDFGAGVLAARPGPAYAGPGLQGALGLAWRLQRGAVLGWAAGLLVTGVAYGSIGDDVGDLIGDSSSATRDMFLQAKGALVDAFYATSIIMLALIAAGFAVSSALRPRSEEDNGLVESLLATGLTRRRWLLAHVTVTVLGTVAVVLCAGLGLGLGYAMVTGDTSKTGEYTLATLGYLAPVLVLAGLARLLYGLSARAAGAAWLGLVLSVVVMLFGELLQIPQWLQDLSPFEHLALVPAEDFRWLPFLVLLALAGALSAAGQWSFARRDVH